MRFWALLCLIGALLSAGCSNIATRYSAGTRLQPRSASMFGIPHHAGLALASPISVGAVSIIPVVSSTSPQVQEEYATLSTAGNTVTITEMPSGMEVDQLLVTNRGDKPLLLMAGELVVGGYQDRVIARTMVVPAGGQAIVPSFCVEEDRGTGATSEFRPSGLMVPQRVREAVLTGTQEEVWSRVAGFNSESGAGLGSQSVQAGLRSVRGGSLVGASMPEIVAELKKTANTVGMVIVVDGRIVGMELLGSPQLFAATCQPLVSAYVADAAQTPASEDVKVDMRKCVAFAEEALKSQKAPTGSVDALGDILVTNGALTGRQFVGAQQGAVSGSGPVIHGSYKWNPTA